MDLLKFGENLPKKIIFSISILWNKDINLIKSDMEGNNIKFKVTIKILVVDNNNSNKKLVQTSVPNYIKSLLR